MKNQKNDFIKIHEKTWRNTRRKVKIFSTLMIIFLCLAVVIYMEGYSLEKTISGKNTIIGEIVQNGLNQTNQTEIKDINNCETEAGIITQIFKVFTEWNKGFGVKLLVFLGVVYLAQVIFTLSFDILELVLLIGVLIVKIFKGTLFIIKYPFKNKKK